MLREFSLKRYEKMRYRYCGRSGLQLPEISLGAWETFGGYRGADVARDCLFRAFDLGITHFDLANTYGDPFGNAELVCGMGVIVYCPLASGLLTDKYLGGTIPNDSRAAQKWGKGWIERTLTVEKRARLVALNDLARSRGQTLAQMALAWILRLPTITSALIGASSVKQVEENVAALDNLVFSDEELKRIDALTKG